MLWSLRKVFQRLPLKWLLQKEFSDHKNSLKIILVEWAPQRKDQLDQNHKNQESQRLAKNLSQHGLLLQSKLKMSKKMKLIN